uniref:Protein Malvolio n=2 Tax=Bursaphelenchus xylophilus TaxID=6326 RepID=A0A1I7SR14_BURXY
MAVDSEDRKGDEDKESEEIIANDETIQYLVEIPEDVEKTGFSFRKLWAFTGPGFLMSIAYLDPGNIESDLQSGATARYQLLWVLLFAHVLGFALQLLSAQLGVVSGRHMAEVSRELYPRWPRYALWIMVEIAIIGSDMQEVIGTAVAIYMLSYGKVSLLFGVLITMLDTLTFLFIDHFGFRKLEGFFAFLIALMAITFGFEFFMVQPDAVDLAKGIFIPWCSGCGQEEFLQGVSVVGAVIMPHNLYLHSALVKSRRIDRKRKKAVEEATFYYGVESGIALICSFIINMFVVGVFAHGLYDKSNLEVRETCNNRDVLDPTLFPMDNSTVEADLYRGGIFLECTFGKATLIVWGIGILASGQSSTMTGTYAGQFVMEGFLHMKWPRWRRVMVTRLIAIIPTVVVTLFAEGVRSLTGMNDLLNCVQMIILPFALLPIITFTANYNVMFEYKTGKKTQFAALTVSLIVIGINLYFSTGMIFSWFGTSWTIYLMLAPPIIVYVLFVIYLFIVCLQIMGICSTRVLNFNFLRAELGTISIKPLWQPESPNSCSGTAIVPTLASPI